MSQTVDGSQGHSEGHATNEPVTSLDLDTTFHLLQNERRRLALRYLLDRRAEGEHVVEMRTLAEQVAAWEHDTTVAELGSDQRQRVYIGLYQSHLPTLDEHGVIDYEQARGRVELNERASALEPYLERTPGTGAHTPAAGTPPPAAASDTRDDEGGGRGLSHLLLGVFGFVPLAVVASQFGPDIAVSGALLVLILAATALLGGGVQRYVTSGRDV